MAWTDQCKLQFVSNANHLIKKQKKKNVRAVLKELHKDSGIPYSTLENWYYQEQARLLAEAEAKEKTKTEVNTGSEKTKSSETGVNDNANDNTGLSDNAAGSDDSQKQPVQDAVVDIVHKHNVCLRCGNNPLWTKTETGNPATKLSAYYGLCSACRKYQERITAVDKKADAENGILAFCPKCREPHYIAKSRIKE